MDAAVLILQKSWRGTVDRKYAAKLAQDREAERARIAAERVGCDYCYLVLRVCVYPCTYSATRGSRRTACMVLVDCLL